MDCPNCGIEIGAGGMGRQHVIHCKGPEEPTPAKKHPGLRGAQQQACRMFEVVRELERVRMRARDAEDTLMVKRLSRALSDARNMADLFIDREHDPHAGRSPYAPDDALEATIAKAESKPTC